MPESPGPSESTPRSFFSDSAAFGPVEQRVVLTDIDIPFWSLVGLMVKASLASIPAVLILTVIWLLFVGVVGGMLGFFGSLLR
jgi:hypothetical protein